MPFSFSIDVKNNRVNTDVIGDFTTQEMIELLVDVTNHPDYTPAMDILSDHTQIGEALTPTQAEDFISFIDNIRGSMSHTRWAVVTRKLASYGMMRLLSVKLERVPMTLRVFKTTEDAEIWLAEDNNS